MNDDDDDDDNNDDNNVGCKERERLCHLSLRACTGSTTWDGDEGHYTIRESIRGTANKPT